MIRGATFTSPPEAASRLANGSTRRALLGIGLSNPRLRSVFRGTREAASQQRGSLCSGVPVLLSFIAISAISPFYTTEARFCQGTRSLSHDHQSTGYGDRRLHFELAGG